MPKSNKSIALSERIAKLINSSHSLLEIVEITGASKPTVYRHVRKLEDEGAIPPMIKRDPSQMILNEVEESANLRAEIARLINEDGVVTAPEIMKRVNRSSVCVYSHIYALQQQGVIKKIVSKRLKGKQHRDMLALRQEIKRLALGGMDALQIAARTGKTRECIRGHLKFLRDDGSLPKVERRAVFYPYRKPNDPNTAGLPLPGRIDHPMLYSTFGILFPIRYCPEITEISE